MAENTLQNYELILFEKNDLKPGKERFETKNIFRTLIGFLDSKKRNGKNSIFCKCTKGQSYVNVDSHL